MAVPPPETPRGGSDSQGSSAGAATSGGKSARDLTKGGVVVGFSGFPDELTARMKRLVENHLKGVVEEKSERTHTCTHLVVIKPVKRTVKLCIGISASASCQVVTMDWLTACENAKAFVDTKPFLLTGEHANANGASAVWSFNASTSRKLVAESGGTGCLSGTAFYVTKNPKPTTRFKDADLHAIIRAAGGQVCDKPPSSSDKEKTVVVSTEEERKAWEPLARLRNVSVINFGHLLTCVLRARFAVSGGELE